MYPLILRFEFSDGLKGILGYDKSVLSTGSHVSKYPLELHAGITEIFVYTDIVEASMVGEYTAPLIRVIPVMGDVGDQISKVYPTPMFFPLKKSYFDTIEIELRSSFGSYIKFIGGKTIVVLSFRRRV